MKKAKKYTTFNELKSSESRTSDYSLALKRHSDFEKMIREIMLIKFRKSDGNS